MSDPPGSPEPPRPTPHEVWARATMWIAIVALVLGASLYVFRSCLEAPGKMIDRTGQAIGKAGTALASVASAFNRGMITTSFISYASSVSSSRYLQFATLKQMELFTRKDEKSTAFGYLSLPEVIVEARAPVECTYYLDLSAEWRLVVQDNVMHVFAPEIKFNKPAVDVSKLEFEVKKGIVKTKEVQEDLRRSITFLMAERARENISLVRETGRRQTAEFVEQWLAKSFSDGKVFAVKVYFPEEKPPLNVPAPAPVLK